MANDYTTVRFNGGRISHVELKITNKIGDFIIIKINKSDEKRVSLYTWNFSKPKNADCWNIKAHGPDGSLHLGRYILRVTDPNKIVDCKDKNRLNMLRSNMRVVSRSRNALNRKIPAHNTTGRVGISVWKSKYGVNIWTATGTVKGKKISKSYSASKYGNAGAKKLAIQFREKFERDYGVLSERNKEAVG